MGRTETSTFFFNQDLLKTDLTPLTSELPWFGEPLTKVQGGKKFVQVTTLEGLLVWQELKPTKAVRVNLSQLPEVIQSLQELSKISPQKVPLWLRRKMEKIKIFPKKKELESQYWGTIAHQTLFTYRVILELLLGKSSTAQQGLDGISPSLHARKKADFLNRWEVASSDINTQEIETLLFTGLRRMMVEWVNLNKPYLTHKATRTTSQLSYFENPHNIEQRLSKAWNQSAERITSLQQNLENAFSWVSELNDETPSMIFCETGCTLNFHLDEQNKIQIPVIIDIFKVRVLEDGDVKIEIGDYKTGQAKEYQAPALPTLLQVLLIKVAAKEISNIICKALQEGIPLGTLQWQNFVFSLDKKPLESIFEDANRANFKYHFPDSLDDFGDIPSKAISVSSQEVLKCAQLLEHLIVLLGPNGFRPIVQTYLAAAKDLSEIINPVAVDEDSPDFQWQRMLI